ncbi:hypothetical protein [Bacillus mojavensis]
MNTYAWVDRDYKYYQMEEISDRYLLNILKFMCRGGGYTSFLSHERIENLFKEADRRGLNHGYDLSHAIMLHDMKEYAEEVRLNCELVWR